MTPNKMRELVQEIRIRRPRNEICKSTTSRPRRQICRGTPREKPHTGLLRRHPAVAAGSKAAQESWRS